MRVLPSAITFRSTWFFRSSRSALLFLCLGACVLAGGWAAPTSSLWADEEETASVSSLKKELRNSMRTHSTMKAQLIAGQLAALQTDEAIDVLVDVGLLGDNYELERHIGGLLRDMPTASCLKRICHLAQHHKDYKARVILSVVLGKRKEPEAFAALMSNLEDRYPAVVLAVLEIVRESENLDAVSYLIDAIKFQEKASGGGDGLIKYEIRVALTRLTGYDYESSVDWTKLWNPYRKDHSSFRRRGHKEKNAGTGVVLKRPNFFGHEIPDDKILFVLDISGSMMKKDPLPEESGVGDGKGDGPSTGVRKKKRKKKKKEPPQSSIPDSRRRISRVQAELVRVIRDLPVKARFNIITFNHLIDTYKDDLVPATPKNKELATRFVTNVNAEGQTHTDEALERAFDLQGITSIYFLSDGAPRRDDVLLDIKPILDRVREVNRFRRIRINTIGFAQAGGNLREFMRKLAFQNKGKYQELR